MHYRPNLQNLIYLSIVEGVEMKLSCVAPIRCATRYCTTVSRRDSHERALGYLDRLYALTLDKKPLRARLARVSFCGIAR